MTSSSTSVGHVNSVERNYFGSAAISFRKGVQPGVQPGVQCTRYTITTHAREQATVVFSSG